MRVAAVQGKHQLQEPMAVVRGVGRRLTLDSPAVASPSRTIASCWAASRARAWPRKSVSFSTVCSDWASRSRSLVISALSRVTWASRRSGISPAS